METRSRKRTRVSDYNNDEAVVERAAKRVKKEKNVKQEIKKEVKIKQEPKNVKKEQKIKIKSEIKSEVKIELKKEKKEQKIKLETKPKIKKEPGVTEETTDQAEEIENIDVSESGLAESNEVVEISDDSEHSREGDDSEEDNEEKSKEDDKAKFNFKEFKTIVLSGNGLRWKNPTDQPQMKFNTNIIEKIMSVSAVPQIMIWARVSKLTSNIVHGSQSLWQRLFRERNWRLPHEIRNHNFKFRTEGGDATEPIPPLKIADKKVDWFSEFKRNYATSSEIKSLATYLCKHYTGGEPMKGDEDQRMTEEELLEWEEENNYYVPNDYRDYCKYSWIRLRIPYITGIETICGPDMSLSRLYRLEDDEDASTNDDWVNEHYRNDEDTPGRPDLDSISKLVDIPKKKLKADIAGLLFLCAPTHYTFEIYVPYVNMIFEDQGELVSGETILQRLRKLKKKAKQKI